MATCKPRLAFQQGFTTIGVLVFAAILALSAAAALQVGALAARRAAEEELLAIGAEFRAALASYAAATPIGQSRAPASFDDLLRDPRTPAMRRHLRRVYRDPLTGEATWETVPAIGPQGMGGIGGIYSLAPGKPLKIGNFSTADRQFEGKAHYADWVFTLPPADAAPEP